MKTHCLLLVALIFACLAYEITAGKKEDKDKNKIKKKFQKKNINCDDTIPSSEEICRIAARKNLTNFKYFDGCDDCECKPGSNAECSKNECDDPQDKKDGKYCFKVNKLIFKQFKNASKWSKYAKKSWKSAGSKFSNQRFDCSDIINPSEICQENFTDFKFYDGCNECTCNTSGADCTTEVCPKTPGNPRTSWKCKKLLQQIEEDKNNSRNHIIDCFEKEKICEKFPGAAYFDGCNDCWCAEKQESCTYKLCHFFGTERQLKRFCRLQTKIYKSDSDDSDKDDKSSTSDDD